MTQFQVSRSDPTQTRVVPVTEQEYAARVGDGDALVRVDRFGLSANNVTYVMCGDRLGYWRFFPAECDEVQAWGVMPVWGFGEVVVSQADGAEVGERLFGYFPPATHLLVRPSGSPGRPLIDTAAHRVDLPKAYNAYQRVLSEPDHQPGDDDLRMLLYPLFITSWALWESLRGADWYGAEQVVVVSASSKTALGLAQALKRDESAPPTVGLTSPANRSFVDGLDLYDDVVPYDEVVAAVARRPSVIIDMAGSAAVLGGLHRHLGDAMLRSLNVGLTHWDAGGGGGDLIRERSEVFFAPGVLQARMTEWGPQEYGRRSQRFLADAIGSTRDWLSVERFQGLGSLADLYAAVRTGSATPDRGFVIAP